MIYVNGRGLSPLATIAAIAACIFFGILLLPILSGLFIAILLFILVVVLYGIYWRWRHGDPLKHMQEELAARMQAKAEGRETHREDPKEAKAEPANRTRVGVKRVAEVEDAVIIDETDPRH